ncbi:hypothetical protein BFF78_04740 [Streptomyces fodineus]|uniref:Uncharacterized protein n=1 Tax=Streptomyces fodineus TaxID=1904616 RepID=A0A1D7Y4H3_9ACTN|nr:hypothetical protein BFF78_04740 [Streptomyces fodineus]
MAGVRAWLSVMTFSLCAKAESALPGVTARTLSMRECDLDRKLRRSDGPRGPAEDGLWRSEAGVPMGRSLADARGPAGPPHNIDADLIGARV